MWTTNVQADQAAIGSLVNITFRGAFNPQMRITELDPPTRLGWAGAGGHAAWGETTTIRFELDETSHGTLVRFWHRLGLEVSDEAVATANFNWGYFLDSLRLVCETGSGKPFRSGTAGARVGASGIA